MAQRQFTITVDTDDSTTAYFLFEGKSEDGVMLEYTEMRNEFWTADRKAREMEMFGKLMGKALNRKSEDIRNDPNNDVWKISREV